MTDIIFTRIYHSLEEVFGYLSRLGYLEISNGLCWLAAVTRENNYRTELIDALALKLDNTRLVELIMQKNPKYVGISACTMDIYKSSDLAEKLKETRPDIITIIGGPHITAVPEETMKRFPAFDIGVVGEGELVIVELLNYLEGKGGRDKREIGGIIYRDEGKIIQNPRKAFIEDLNTLPLPAWDLLPDLKKHYFAPAWTGHGGQTATIITSRGCPSQCIYCDRKVFGNRIRFHNAEYVLRMIKTLHAEYAIKHLRIADDNFILDKKRLYKICDYLIKENLKITWSCLARADSVNEEMLFKMKQAGCWSIAYGVETGSQAIHDIEKKKIKLKQIAEAIRLTRKAKIRTISFNMIGHPMETVETIKQTIDFNKKIKVDDFKTQFLMPFPGTELYENAEKYGTFDRDWRKMSVFQEPIFIPYGLTKEDLIKWNKKGFRSFYLQPRIIFSYLAKIRSWGEVKTILIGAFTLMYWIIKDLLSSKALKRIRKLLVNFIPTVIKTGVLYRIPSLYSLFEIRPSSSLIFITDNCNSRCIMCKQWRRPAGGELSTEDWGKVIVDLRRNGISNIHFSGGEPLLRRDLAELISQAAHKGFTTGITTNGLLLDRNRLQELIDAGLNSIAISLDAIGGEYEKIRGIPNSFERVKVAASLIAEAKRNNRICAYINYTLMKDTMGEFRNVKKLADDLDLPLAVCLLDKSSYIFDLEENKKDLWINEDHDFETLKEFVSQITSEKVKKPHSMLLNFPMVEFIRRYFRDPIQRTIPCVSSQDRVIIDPSGNLLGGCMSMGAFGNIKERSLSELINEERYKTAKKKMFYKNCAGCSCGYQFNVQHAPGLIARDFFERVRYLVFKK